MVEGSSQQSSFSWWGREDRLQQEENTETAERVSTSLCCEAAAAPVDQRQQRHHRGGGDWEWEDHSADPVLARGRVHQVRHDRVHPAQEGGGHVRGEESKRRDWDRVGG